MLFRKFLCLLLLVLIPASISLAQTREEKVRSDRQKVLEDGFWIYNDLDKGFEQARQTGKPLVVVLRCIPCVACVKLDDELVDQDPVIRPLLKEFVCVRIVSTNGLDLSLFQYDTDQSFAVFMLNADGTIYGRFGTRSHRTDWYEDVSLTGLAKALQGALTLHQNYPSNKSELAGKRGKPLEYASPEKYPSLKDKYRDSIDFADSNVVKSCIHCHQIGDARRDYYWSHGKKLPEDLLFPYPHPKSIGLILDPEAKATVKEVTSNTPASKAGFRAGDEIVSLQNQPLLSIADVQWVLDKANPECDRLTAEILRNGRPQKLTIELQDGWRRYGDISWRVSSWQLRRKYLGGMKLDELTTEERKQANLADGQLALRIGHVGKYPPHNFAQRSGLKEGDIITSFDGHSDLVSETDLLIHGADNFKPAQTVSVTILRNGNEIQKQLKLP